MATPAKGYYLKDGTRVPSVTTIIGKFKPSENLIDWSWRCGRDGLDYKEVRDRAANIGKCSHAMVEAHVGGQGIFNFLDELPDPDDRIKALNAYNAYLAWRLANPNIEIFEPEVSLLSETYRFGGTLDAIGREDGKLVLLDWKTSGGTYADHVIQLAAYEMLWAENNAEPLTKSHLVRLDKDTSSFEAKTFTDLSIAKRQFLRLRECYGDAALIEKQLKAA